MLATRDDGARERLTADKTGKGQLFLFILDLELAHIHRVVLLCIHLLVNLPACLVVTTVVKELAVVTEAAKACFLVVLANIRLVIPAN